MNVFQIAIIVFTLIESANILTLYFNAQSKLGNGIGIFKAFTKEQEEDTSMLQRYLVDWVAGTKLIFVMLGLVIAFFGTYETQMFAMVAYIISIATFYFRLYPNIRKMDKKDYIDPKGYSKTLNTMILFILLVFVFAFFIEIL